MSRRREGDMVGGREGWLVWGNQAMGGEWEEDGGGLRVVQVWGVGGLTITSRYGIVEA